MGLIKKFRKLNIKRSILFCVMKLNNVICEHSTQKNKQQNPLVVNFNYQ